MSCDDLFRGKKNCKHNWQKITLSQPLSWSLWDSFVSLLPNVHVTSLHYRYLIMFSPLRFWVKSIKRMPSTRSWFIWTTTTPNIQIFRLKNGSFQGSLTFCKLPQAWGLPYHWPTSTILVQQTFDRICCLKKEATILNNYHCSQS